VSGSPGLLEHPPSGLELSRLYHELSLRGAPAVGRHEHWPYIADELEDLIALAAEMLRYDARLLSILLQFVLEHWSEFNPLRLRRCMQRMRWPQALLVVFEFAREASREPELRYLGDYLGAGFERVNPSERFFLDMERPGSRVARRRAGRNLKPYKRWGFIGSERPTADSVRKRLVGGLDTASRAHVRARLLERRDSFALSEYLEALDHSISRQQAYADLRADPELLLVGRGRGARWTKSS